MQYRLAHARTTRNVSFLNINPGSKRPVTTTLKKTSNAPMYKFKFLRFYEEQGYENSLPRIFIKSRHIAIFRIIEFNLLM